MFYRIYEKELYEAIQRRIDKGKLKILDLGIVDGYHKYRFVQSTEENFDDYD